MLRPLRRLAIRIVAARSRKRHGGWSPRSFALFVLRRQAEVGLLRDGGMTSAEVSCYVRDLRREIECEVAARRRKAAP